MYLDGSPDERECYVCHRHEEQGGSVEGGVDERLAKEVRLAFPQGSDGP